MQIVSQKAGTTRIVSGTAAQPNSWPWAAALFEDNTQFCGGSLVQSAKGDWWIVTAAHCLCVAFVLAIHALIANCSDAENESKPVSTWRVKLGAHYKKPPGEQSWGPVSCPFCPLCTHFADRHQRANAGG